MILYINISVRPAVDSSSRPSPGGREGDPIDLQDISSEGQYIYVLSSTFVSMYVGYGQVAHIIFNLCLLTRKSICFVYTQSFTTLSMMNVVKIQYFVGVLRYHYWAVRYCQRWGDTQI